MDRLTAQWGKNHAVPTKLSLDFAWDMSDIELQKLLCILDRLAAYEETGLTPEEIKDNMEMFHAYRHICAGLDPDRLRELLQADRDGRCVVVDEQLALAMLAGSRGIRKARLDDGKIYVYDPMGADKEIPYAMAANVLYSRGKAALAEKEKSNEQET